MDARRWITALLLAVLVLAPGPGGPRVRASVPTFSPSLGFSPHGKPVHSLAGSISADSTLVDSGWDVTGDQAGAHLGRTVSTAGDVNGDGYTDVIVGAPGYDVGGKVDAGRIYLYYGTPSGLASKPDWSADGKAAGDNLGGAVGTAGDVNGDGYADVIAGAWNCGGDQPGEGCAYVYHGGPDGLSTTPDWIAEGNQPGASYGIAVSTAGDVNGDGYADAAVGAHLYDGPGGTLEDQGRVYLYYGSPEGLHETPAWTDEGGQPGALLGYSLDTAGDVNGDGYADLIAGAKNYDGGQPDEGRACVYYGSEAGLSLVADWTEKGNQTKAHFGAAVASAGDVNGDGYADVAVGAPNYSSDPSDDTQKNEGWVFVYHGSSTGLSRGRADWIVEGNFQGTQLGWAVGPAGDVNGDGYADLIAGAPFYRESLWQEGRADVYLGSSTGLAQTVDWTGAGRESDARFGIAVGTAGDVNGDGYADLIVGAHLSGPQDQGRVSAYHGGAIALGSGGPDWITEGSRPDAAYGAALSSAGDVNGDGYADLIAGAPGYAPPGSARTNAGRAIVYHGGPLGTLIEDWTDEGSQSETRLGSAVDTAGDVNGDGYADVIVGAPGVGRAALYRGSVTGLSTNPAWTLAGQVLAEYGAAVAAAGDVNGDGYADVAVGAPGEPPGGRVYLYYGGAGGLSGDADRVLAGDQSGGRLGSAVGTAGDVDGDGYSDLIAGAPGAGRVYLYRGSAAGLGASPAQTLAGSVQAEYGAVVAAAGDVNGDGYADVAVGAPEQAPGGRVYLYYGGAGGLSETAGGVIAGDQAGSRFGGAVHTAGDVNGDGYADLLVGVPGFSTGALGAGSAVLYLGSPTGLVSSAAWQVAGEHAEAGLGAAVGCAGDVNGDGYADLLLGVPGHVPQAAQAAQALTVPVGAVQLYYGNGGPGQSLTPRQMRADGAAPIAPLGLSDSSTEVQLRLTGRMPLGSELVCPEWQVAPLGAPFAGPGTPDCSGEGWKLARSGGVEFVQPVGGLSPSTLYRWRVRLLYRPGNRLGLSAGRWLYPAAQGRTGQAFRTGYPQVSFANSTYRADEHAGSAAITVTLSQAAGLAASVDYTTAPDSATPGQDYQPVSGTLSFAPGQLQRVFEVPLLDDAKVEGDEQLVLMLSRPQNATLGSIHLAKLTLVDDEGPGVHFERPTYSVGEGAGVAELEVRLSAAFTLPVTVGYVTRAGSAAAGADYEPISGTLTFAEGTMRTAVHVPLIADDQPELDEWLEVILSDAVNAKLVDPSRTKVWIVNDDPFIAWLPLVQQLPSP